MDTWRCTRGRGIVGSVADEVEEAIHRSRWRLRSLSVVICVILLGLCGWGASLIARGLSADLGHMVIFVGIGLIPFGMTGLVLLFFVDGPSVPATPHLREQYGAAELEPETRAFKALARGAKRVGLPAPRHVVLLAGAPATVGEMLREEGGHQVARLLVDPAITPETLSEDLVEAVAAVSCLRSAVRVRGFACSWRLRETPAGA